MRCLRLNNKTFLQRRGCSQKGSGGGLVVFTFYFLLFISCAPKAYKNLQQLEGSAECLEQFQPKFERVVYRTSVDVIGNHLSGILLIKQMPDSSTRLLFTNEAGYKFFDFEFSKSGDFKVHSIIEKMDKDAVKKTLQRDFQLLLMNKPIRLMKPYEFRGQKNEEKYFAYNAGEDFYYYITNADCSKLIRMERGSSTKKVLEAFVTDMKDKVPDSIQIHHINFNFDINMKRIYDNAE